MAPPPVCFLFPFLLDVVLLWLARLDPLPVPVSVLHFLSVPDPTHWLPLQAQHGAALRSHTDQQGSVVDLQAEHGGMRTYFFSADTQEDLNTWLRAMKQATMMHNQSDTLSRWVHTHSSTV